MAPQNGAGMPRDSTGVLSSLFIVYFACVGRDWPCEHHAEQRQQREESPEN